MAKTIRVCLFIFFLASAIIGGCAARSDCRLMTALSQKECVVQFFLPEVQGGRSRRVEFSLGPEQQLVALDTVRKPLLERSRCYLAVTDGATFDNINTGM